MTLGNDDANATSAKPKPKAKGDCFSHHRVGLYSNNQSILVCGDGDLSFSLSLARGFSACVACAGIKTCPHKANSLVCSSYESQTSIAEMYPSSLDNIKELRSLGATVLFQIDATKLEDFIQIPKAAPTTSTSTSSDAIDATSEVTASNAAPKPLQPNSFDRIVFNFPCVRRELGDDGQTAQIEENRVLIKSFLRTSQSLLRSGAEVHISHKTVKPFGDWQVEKMCEDNAGCELSYKGAVVFDRSS
jgi:25S rRNA (uracil2634-N3)-methyltransferase